MKETQKPPLISHFFPHHVFITLDKENLEPLALIPILLSYMLAQMVKNSPAVWETWVQKIPWRRAWPPTPELLPGESPWKQESSGLQSMGSQRVGHD